MPTPSIAHLDRHYNSILFRGFHFLPERASDGWVYWMPRYLLRNTSLQLYFLDNDGKLFFLDKNETLHQLDSGSVNSVDIFFGRTANSYNPKNPLMQNAKLKIIYPIRSELPESCKGQGLVVVEDSTFIKPIPEHDRTFFFYQPGKKEEYLLYPAAFYKLKGQLKFAKKVSRKALQGRKVIFCGSLKSESYAEECFEILRRKNIDFEYLKKVSKQELGELYRKARLTIFFSNGDFNPRIFYESMACGTPCLLSKNVKLAESLEQHAFRTSSFMMNRNLRKYVDYPREVEYQLHEAAGTLTEESCYEQLFCRILQEKRSY